jgi:hypothetical protein
MPQLLLHIGGEKTGTTTLQAFLRRNADLLMRRYGVLYPLSGPLNLDNGHFPVATAFVDPAQREFVPPRHWLRPADVSAALSDLVRTQAPKLILLSAEHFSSRLLRPGIERLAEAIGPISTKVLFYVRRQDELALSAQSTGLRCGSRHWLDAAKISPEVRYFNYLTIADDWAAVFGRENLELRSFDDVARGIEADFLSAIGVSREEAAAPVERRNPRISLQEAAVLHALNQHLPDHRDAARTGAYDDFHAAYMLRERILGIARQEPAARTPLASLLTPDLRRSIMSAFAESNRELAAKYGVEIPDDIPPPTAIPNAELDRADLLAGVLARAGREILSLDEQLSALRARTLRGRLRTAKESLRRYLRTA